MSRELPLRLGPMCLRRRLDLLSACAGAVLLSGCDVATGAGVTTYRLATIDDAPLPAPFTATTSYPVFNVLRGSLVLGDDGTVTEELTLRCRTDLPEWVSCLREDDLVLNRSGTLSGDPPTIRLSNGEHSSVSTQVSRRRIALETQRLGDTHSATFEYVR